MLKTRKKAPFRVLFCGLLQSFTPPGIDSPRWVWYLNQQLF
ncbi:transcriptional regulator [Enterobacter cloacae]|uniref:Transcriptional regulator n=1 Tax=Enterobacter cloacae TaxID=550 RepID=A0A2T4XX07_ENTCL|nr:transcriptional regulator [Enterobacter cloacae]RWS56514.1 transcriptional regulator [Enterobacter cloacae]RXW29620.1 transcriptional regulator [Enterobacter cloacae]TFF58646.1 transcriptional regulator [Enterobacter sp. A11]